MATSNKGRPSDIHGDTTADVIGTDAVGALEVARVASHSTAADLHTPWGKSFRFVIRAIELVTATVVCAEIFILLAGVLSRYVFSSPLTWTDEAASTLFIWLAMLGAVIALDRGEHMRLTAVVNMAPGSWVRWLETVTALVVALFVLALLPYAYQHIVEQSEITTPALGIPDSYRVAAIGVGAVLMLLIAVTRLIERSTLKQVISGIALIGLVAAALWLARPLLIAMGSYNLIVFFVILFGTCIAAGIPIAFSFGVATISYLAVVTTAPLLIVVGRMDEGISSLILLAIPLFVFLGLLIEMTGLAKVLIDFMAALLGHVRGGLSFVLLGAMFLVSGISGSKAADMAAVAPALFPEMRKRGSKPGELVAILSATGAMTETIPPSLVLITVGAVAGVSIAALFTGGLFPAVVATIAIAVICFARSRGEDLRGVKRAPWSQAGRAFVIALPALALPFLIRAAVMEGVATATEVATLGVAYTVIVGLLVYRRFDWSRVYPMLIETAALSGAILLIIGMATAMAWALTQSGFSKQLVQMMQSVPGGKYGFLLISILTFVVLGSILEGIPAVVLFAPLLFPAARVVGIHDVHYAMVVILALGLGLFAPPFGVGFYAACAIGKVSPDEAFGRIWAYLGALLVAAIIIAFVPWLSIVFL